VPLNNGESLWVVFREEIVTPKVAAIIKETKAKVLAAHQTAIDFSESGLRGMLIGTEPDGSKVFYEVALTQP